MTRTNTPTAVASDDRADTVRRIDDTLGVPRPSVVLRTCAVTSANANPHPLLRAAVALAALHRSRVEADQLVCDPAADDHALAIATRAIAAADTGRVVLMGRIDQWACAVLPVNRHAAVHTESLGRLVDRVVGTWTQWNLVKDRDDPGSADLAANLLRHVSELSIGYDDLIADLRDGRRRLPRHLNPIAA